MEKGIKLLIVGGGMFVTGRGSNNYGTVLPAIFEAFRKMHISEIIFVTTNPKSAAYAKKSINIVSKKLNINIPHLVFPIRNNNNNEYLRVAKLFRPQAAIISVPDHLHFKITSNLIKLQIHCLVVKPLCNTLMEAKKLVELSKKNKVLGLVEFHKRYDESNLIIKNKINSKQIGSLLYAVIEYSQKKIIPTKIFKKWINQTNVFQYLAVHYVDLLYFFTHFKPITVKAWGQKEYLKSKKIDNWDSIQVVIEWLKPNGNKFISTHLTNWIESDKSSAMSDQKITIVGTNGKIVSNQKKRGLEIINDKLGTEEINPYFTTFDESNSSSFFGYGIRSITEFLANVNSIIYEGTDYRKFTRNNRSFEEALISSSIIESVNKSLRNSKTEKIKV